MSQSKTFDMVPKKRRRNTDSSINNALECGVCSEQFSLSGDKVPRLLLCGHSFCHDCLTRLPIQAGKILCPMDRQITDVGDGGVWNLKKNFALIELMEKLELGTVSCNASCSSSADPSASHNSSLLAKDVTLCDEDDGHVATLYCVVCSTNLCHDCSIFTHSTKTLSKHRRINLKGKPKQPTMCPLPMMCQGRGRRKRDGGTFTSDADDIINAMLIKMKQAAEADREANKLKKPAACKLKMLTTVVRHLKKQDLKEAFVDMGVIAAIADWLSLLPDGSLPHFTIRSELLAILHDLPSIIPETLKSSGIGRAVMMVFKHPKEIRKNKESAGRLINKWTRPILGSHDNFKSMSRGEREQRDLEQIPQSKRRRLNSVRSGSERAEVRATSAGRTEFL